MGVCLPLSVSRVTWRSRSLPRRNRTGWSWRRYFTGRPSRLAVRKTNLFSAIRRTRPFSVDCLHPLGPNQWAIHVPLGKLKTERWVPVDSRVCQLVERIRSLRPPTAPKTGRLLLFRPRGSKMLVRRIRAALQDVVAAVGISAHIVPHQFRHTYGTEMLRAGVNFAAVMTLLGHKSPDMTLEYLEVTQQDLQREFHLARSHPRHLPPSWTVSSASPPRAGETFQVLLMSAGVAKEKAATLSGLKLTH